MKKIYACSTILFLSTSISLTAQNQNLIVEKDLGNIVFTEKTIEEGSIQRIPFVYKNMNTSAAPTERWYNYGSTMGSIMRLNNSKGGLYFNNLFPDTTILVKYSNSNGSYTYSGPFIHNLGDVLDVTSANFNNRDIHANELNLSKKSSFTLDSISFICRYNRKTSDTIVDTLVVEVATNQPLSSYRYYTGTTLNTYMNEVDTIRVKTIPYSYTTNSLNITRKQVFKIPLTNLTYADSLDDGFHAIKCATTGLDTIFSGNYIVSSVHFIPGYDWIANTDTLSNKNSIRFFAYKEQVNGPLAYTKGDYNMSYIIPSNIRYNLDKAANGWNGKFIPSFVFMNSISNYEHHLINYKVTCLSGCGTVSINELEATEFINGIKLFQNQPNPSNGSTFISYELGESSSVALAIYDITGKRVMALDEGKKPVGKHSVTINQNQLKSGIYFYTLTGNGGNSLTKKMIITE